MSKKKNKVGSLARSNVETYDKSKVIKMVWCWLRGRQAPGRGGGLDKGHHKQVWGHDSQC